MRPTKYDYYMRLAEEASSMSTCVKRQVGCVLVDNEGKILAIGYNGVARGRPHCNEGHECKLAFAQVGHDECEAVHAEQNALLQCADPEKISLAIVTLSPCRSCVKLLLNTSCVSILYREKFEDLFPEQLWTSMGRTWLHCSEVSIV